MPIPYSDQREIFNPDQWAWPVHVVGLGGIGASVVFPLVKLGVSEIHLWDDDRVEPHNIPSQLIYRPSDIGSLKVEAAEQFFLRQEVGCEVIAHPERVSNKTELEGVVISGVDSMASRKAIWSALRWNGLVPLYMDGRIGGEKAMLLSVNPSDSGQVSFYESWLFDDSESPQLPCAARTVIHPPQQIAAWVTTNLTLFARGKSPKENLTVNLQGMQYAVSTS